MKGSFTFDLTQCRYGAATEGVRDLLRLWFDIDWFVPRADADADAQALALFEAHLDLARRSQPNLFYPRQHLKTTRGGWPELNALCGRVRAPQKWSWKFDGLKRMSQLHAAAHGWDGAKKLTFCRPEVEGGLPRPGDLFLRVGDGVVWCCPTPVLRLRDFVPAESVEVAAWYLAYACGDLMEALEWQLAEESSKLDGNPFVPLLRCYAAGVYPFCLDPTTAVLFGLTSS